jgi:hypothetical protein
VQRLDASPDWAGIWDLEVAGPHAILSYLRAYGPATTDHVRYWLGSGLSAGGRRLDRWLGEVRERLAAVDVEGESAYVVVEDLDGLMAARPSEAVRLLPGHDQWVMGPGTSDEHIVPPAHRSLVTRGADLAVVGGVVAGTWSVSRDEVSVTWFDPHGQPARGRLEAEVDRLAVLLGRPLTVGPAAFA